VTGPVSLAESVSTGAGEPATQVASAKVRAA
jgi:hypothetical protein